MAQPAPPAITVTDPARKLLERHLADSPEAQFIRVHVGRS
jgi:hypothetical protein